MSTAQEATSGPLINIKFLAVISMLCKTECLWELQTWSHKTNLLDILSTSPHYVFRKWTLATKENSNFDLRVLRVKTRFFNKGLALVLLRVFGTWNRLLHVHLAWIPEGVLGISSNRDDRRIFLGLKFSIPGFFWVRKFGKYFFG